MTEVGDDALDVATWERLPLHVRAAGGIPRRIRDGVEEVLVVHRPHRDDWSFPKGKLDPGEDEPTAALREVLEETGYVCVLQRFLGTVRYRDNKDRPKTVWYWALDVADGEATENDEVDELRWLPPSAAAELLSYDTDRLVLRRLLNGEQFTF